MSSKREMEELAYTAVANAGGNGWVGLSQHARGGEGDES